MDVPDEPLGKHPVVSDPLIKLFYRRKRYDVTAPLIATMRHESFKDIPIEQLVSLAWFSTPREIKVFGVDNPDLVLRVFQKYVSEGCHDLFHDWHMFCKAVKDPVERSEYLLEGAIYFASDAIPGGWRDIWRLRGCELLRLLQRGRQSSDNDYDTQFTSQLNSLDTDSLFVAEMPEAYLLRDVLGGFLQVGMRMSEKRMQEENKRLTSAVRLHFPAVRGKDFKLEVFVNLSAGNAIVQAAEDEDLVRDILGKYLADAVEGSLYWQEGKSVGTMGTSKALAVVPTETTDCRLFILLPFSTGNELFDHLFPV